MDSDRSRGIQCYRNALYALIACPIHDTRVAIPAPRLQRRYSCNERLHDEREHVSSRIRLVPVLVLLLGMSIMLPGRVSAQEEVGPTQVYFPTTGHTVADGFLDYWRQHGGMTIFGLPLTEVVTDPVTKLPTQYFERAVFEWHEAHPPEWQVLLRRLGADMSLDRKAEAPFKRIPDYQTDGCTYHTETGHRVCAGFLAYWEAEGGLPNFGYPLSEEFNEKNPDTGQTYIVQYFERARFEYHPENVGTIYEVLLGRLGASEASRNKVSTAPVPRPEGVEDYDPGLWYIPAPPPPAGAPTWEARWIEIDISDQYMQAWEYNRVVNGTYVSTGLPGYETPTGYFTIFSKLRYDDMTSGLAVPSSEYYYVKDVPHVMYFAAGGYAIHGAYWHSMFGTPFSHGCVSTPLGQAEWFYNWAPYGTTVWIHW